jgi:hypothetical protein
MPHLFQTIHTYLGWHPSRIKCFFSMAMGMIQSRSVQIQRIVAHFQDPTSLEGRIQRIYRFFANQEINYPDIARLILHCLNLQDSPLHLVLDRTNWCFGKISINYLVLAVDVRGFGAVPLLWAQLSKKGNSNTYERIDLLDALFNILPNLRIGCLTADREFVGEYWIDYLMKNKIPFYIRIKANRLVDWSGQKVPVSSFFDHLIIGSKPRKLYKILDGYDLTLAGTRSKDGELVIVLTNTDRSPNKVLKIYKTRWRVECLFKNLKYNGFNLEQTHMTIPKRLEKLMAVCAFAVVLCVQAGILKHKVRPIPYKKTVKSYLYSFFQYGLNFIRASYEEIWKWVNNHQHQLKYSYVSTKYIN